MTEAIDGTQIPAALERVATRVIELRDTLNQLDAAVGDGDLGISTTKGVTGVLAYMDANRPGEDLGKYIAGLGMAYNKAGPSTMGALVATALMRAGKEARGLSVLDGDTLARMLRAADDGVQQRGKAKPGDKTVVDALHPAAAAFTQAIEDGQRLDAAAAAMLDAARAGRDAAIPLRSKIGRASWVGERTEGQPDPGTVLFVQILEAALGVDYSESGKTLG
jgi:dihydroxyacetone kinase-like protein